MRNKCVYCGRDIPEEQTVCLICAKKVSEKELRFKKKSDAEESLMSFLEQRREEIRRRIQKKVGDKEIS